VARQSGSGVLWCKWIRACVREVLALEQCPPNAAMILPVWSYCVIPITKISQSRDDIAGHSQLEPKSQAHG